MRYKFLVLILVLLLNQVLRVSAQEKAQTFTAQGISIEFTVTPARAGEEMTVKFKITDTGGVPLSSLRPVAWIDQRVTKDPLDARMCRE